MNNEHPHDLAPLLSSRNGLERLSPEPHECEIGNFLGTDSLEKRSTVRVHAPELPIHGVTPERQRVPRQRIKECLGHPASACGRLDVEISNPQALVGGVRFIRFAHEHVGDQLAPDFRHEAIEPTISPKPIPHQIASGQIGSGIQDCGGKPFGHLDDRGSILNPH